MPAVQDAYQAEQQVGLLHQVFFGRSGMLYAWLREQDHGRQYGRDLSGLSRDHMTWWAEEHSKQEFAGGTKARQRILQLTQGARQVLKLEGDAQGMLVVRWPMSGWQVWRRVDKEWVELVADAASEEDAKSLAIQYALSKLRAP